MRNYVMKNKGLKFIVLFFAFFMPSILSAQQYGARSFAIAPAGLNVIGLSWERQDLALDPSSIFFKDAEFTTNALIVSYNHYFSLFGKTAQFNVAVPFVFIDAQTGTTFTRPPLTGLKLEANPEGFADPYMHFAVALIGGKSLSAEEFGKKEAGFAFHGLFAVRAPLGEYSNEVALNTGQNRWEIRLGLPVTQQWGMPGKQTTIDFTPVVFFFTDNDDPFGSNRLEQDPLVRLELHITHDFVRGLLAAGLDVNYVFGGETTIDDVPSDNEQDYWTAGFTLGGRLSRKIGWNAIFSYALSAVEELHDAAWFRIVLNYSF